MSLNVAMQLYRGTLANLSALATTGKAGVLAWTTDTNELYVDSGSGSAGIGSGNAWQKVANDLVAVNAQVGTTYTLLATDRSKLVTFSNASSIAVTIPQAGTSFPAGFICLLSNQGVGTVTLTPTTSHIDGATNLALTTGQGVTLVSDGTNWFTVRGLGSIQATSGVANQFVTAISSTGAATLAQPSFSNLSGSATAAQLPNPTTSALGGIQAINAVANEWISSINTSGVPQLSQPGFSNLSGTLTQTQLPTSIGAGTTLTSVDCGSF